METSLLVDSSSLTPKTTIGGPLTKRHDAIIVSSPGINYLKRLGLSLLSSPAFRESATVIAYVSIDREVKRVSLLIPNPDRKTDVMSAINRYIPTDYEISEGVGRSKMNISYPTNAPSPRLLKHTPSHLPGFDMASGLFLRDGWMFGVTENKNGSFSQKEIFGCIGLGVGGELSIDFNSMGFGDVDGVSVDVLSSISFHTHPEAMYYKNKCLFAWPSGRDYNTLAEGVKKIHFVSSREGVYRITTTGVKPTGRLTIPVVDTPLDHVNIMNDLYSEYMTLEFTERGLLT